MRRHMHHEVVQKIELVTNVTDKLLAPLSWCNIYAYQTPSLPLRGYTRGYKVASPLRGLLQKTSLH